MNQTVQKEPAPGAEPDCEAQWLADIAARGPQARDSMQRLHGRYQRMFLSTFKLRGLSLDESLDATQQMWLDVFRKAATYRREAGAPYSWLWGFARISLLAALSERQQREALLVVANVDADGSTAPDAQQGLDSTTLALLDVARETHPRPEEALTLKAVKSCVDQAFEQLASTHPEESRLLYAVHIEGFDADDVARHRGSSLNATYVYLHTARKRFKALVAPCWDLLKA